MSRYRMNRAWARFLLLASSCVATLLAQNPTAYVTVMNQQDTTLGVNGRLQLHMSTSLQPSRYTADFFPTYGTDLLARLNPHHIRIQIGAPLKAPNQWDFTDLAATLASVLSVSDHAPELQLIAPAYMKDSNGRLLPAYFSAYADFCVKMVQYTNVGGFDLNGIHYQSPSLLPVAWFGIENELDLTGMTGEDYATVYNIVVPAMKNVDPTIKIVAGEIAYYHSDFVRPFVSHVTADVDAFAFHYYPVGCTAVTDFGLMNDIASNVPTRIQDLYALLRSNSNLANVIVWMTENNVSYVYNNNGQSSCGNGPFKPDGRTTTAFFPAWRALLFSQLGKSGAGLLHHWDFIADEQFGEVSYQGNPFPAYYLDAWLSALYSRPAPGPMILRAVNSGSNTVEVLAVRNDDASVVVMLINHGVANAADINGAGTPVSLTLDFSALGHFSSAWSLTFDAQTPATGPMPKRLSFPIRTINMDGYGVTFIQLTKR